MHAGGMEKIEAVVIGAGVIGLACARALAQRGLETVILERQESFGREISARSSEVIHAGLYYPAGSLKARLCVEGRKQLYAYCAMRGINHRRCGKLLVATDERQKGQLAALHRQALANGVDDLQILDGAQTGALEPGLSCDSALLSPSTGIIDSHGLMLALLADAESCGATLVCRTPLIGGRIDDDGIQLETGGTDRLLCKAPVVINAAGLQARAVAALLAGFPAGCLPETFQAKGHYFSLQGSAPFSRLVYPLPEAGGLGIHLTLDLAGQARFGPDVEWLEHEEDPPDYRVDPQRAAHFYAGIRRYWPNLPDGALSPAYTGIRPKICQAGATAADFLIQGSTTHGVPGLVNLFGIESPGLTACLGIAEHVASLVTPPVRG